MVFKKGDRVQITKAYGYRAQWGRLGTVVIANGVIYPYAVQIDGRKLPWLVTEDEIELVKED